LFEYEQQLQRKNRSNTAKIDWDEFTKSKEDYVTIEHIYPRKANKPCWKKDFGGFATKQKHQLLHSLGNLVPLAHRKNVSLSNDCFAEKKKPKRGRAGYYNGSYSEIEIAQENKWTPKCALKRGMDLLEFLEKRWEVTLGNPTQAQVLSGSTWQDRSSAKSALGENQGSAKEVVSHYHLLPSVNANRLCLIPTKARL
jgi:hypothetical protein